MKQTTQYIAMLTLLPLIAVLAMPTSVASAANSNICGVQLCSEIQGGRDAWSQDPNRYFPTAPVTEPDMSDRVLSCTIQGTSSDIQLSLSKALGSMVDNTMMERGMMESNPNMTMEETMSYSEDCMSVLKILGDGLSRITSSDMMDTMMDTTMTKDADKSMMKYNMTGTMMDNMNKTKMQEMRDNMMSEDVLSCTIQGTANEISVDLADALSQMSGMMMLSPDMDMMSKQTYTSDCMKVFYLLGDLVMNAKEMDSMMDDAMKDKMMDDKKDKMKDKMMDDKKDKMMSDRKDKKYDKSLELRLSRANVPATIPLHLGYYDGDSVYYIITDASDKELADTITAIQDWKVEIAKPLASAPDSALSTAYLFSDGISGDGINGFQAEVFTTTPAQEAYSALARIVQVDWNDDATPRLLNSADMVMAASDAGELVLTSTDVVVNMPQIVWA